MIDNGANFINAIKILGYPYTTCFNHGLQLALKKGFKETTNIHNLINKCKKIVEMFNKSNQQTEILYENQDKLGNNYW